MVPDYVRSGWPKDAPLPTVSVTDRTPEPLLKAERPWEDLFIGYVQVLRDGRQWHMWYAAADHAYRNDDDARICYARSSDGVNWERPSLGLHQHKGSGDNNIVLPGRAVGHCVFLDRAARPEERFKIVCGHLVQGQWWVFGGTSPDGIRWQISDEPLLKENSDTQTVCFRDGDLYRMYVRLWTGGVYAGKRAVGYAESPRFGGFSRPAQILAPDQNDPADLHFYNSAATKVLDGLYVMFPSAFYTTSQKVLPHLAVSRDGRSFQRIGRRPVLGPGKGFDRMGIYVGPGAVPADKPGRFWFYYVGSGLAHDDFAGDRTKIRYDGGIGRFLVRLQQP